MIKFEFNDQAGKLRLNSILKKLEKAIPTGRKNGRISIALVSGAEIKKLNKFYRKKDKTTDILTFVMESASQGFNGVGKKNEECLGEILLFYGDIEKRAKAAGKSIKETAAYLIVHGVCHIFGHTHNTKADTAKMEKAEKKIMKKAGLC